MHCQKLSDENRVFAAQNFSAVAKMKTKIQEYLRAVAIILFKNHRLAGAFDLFSTGLVPLIV
jgi:hypothetical protein